MKKFVPGLDVPDSYITRLKGVPKDKVAAEGIKIAVEQIQECLAMKGVAGIHLMAIEWEDQVPEIVKAAGLLPRPRGGSGLTQAGHNRRLTKSPIRADRAFFMGAAPSGADGVIDH